MGELWGEIIMRAAIISPPPPPPSPRSRTTTHSFSFVSYYILVILTQAHKLRSSWMLFFPDFCNEGRSIRRPPRDIMFLCIYVKACILETSRKRTREYKVNGKVHYI